MTDRPSPVAALLAFLAALIGSEAFSALLAFLSARGVRLGGFAYAYAFAFEALCFGLPALLFYHRRPALRPALRRQVPSLRCAAVVVIAALLGVFALNWLSVYWMHLLRSLGLSASSGNEAVPRTAKQLYLMLAASALAPAVFEELLFRGLLLPSLEPLGKPRAVLISGAMFALLHGRPEALPAHLGLGILLSLLVIETDSLPAAMLYHAVHNAAITLLSYRAYQSDPSSLAAFPTPLESLQSLPAAVFFIVLWISLSLLSLRLLKKENKRPLPAPARQPLPRLARALLSASGLLLALIELRALLGMLPKGAP